MTGEDWLKLGLCLLLVGTITFFMVDCVGQPLTMAGVGMVQDRQWVHAWWETHIDTDSRGRISTWTEYHPDQYNLLITFEGMTDKYSTGQHQYAVSRMGSPVQMWQRVGRLTGHRYLEPGDVISDGHGSGGGW